MTDHSDPASGITHAPLEKEQEEQAKVPAQGESIIGKGQNRKPSSPHERRAHLAEGDDKDH